MLYNSKTVLTKIEGFTLLEVLVALVVISIGLLGLAALQTNGIRFDKDAYLRTQAVNLAYDVTERMRIDSTNAMANNAYSGTHAPADAGTTCTHSSISATDAITCWTVALRDNIPNGTLTVSNASGTDGNIFTIGISWSNRSQQKGTSVGAYTTSSQSWTIAL